MTVQRSDAHMVLYRTRLLASLARLNPLTLIIAPVCISLVLSAPIQATASQDIQPLDKVAAQSRESDSESLGETAADQPVQLSVSEKPLWEFGIGGGALWGYDYPASRDANDRAIVLPFFIYRTPIFRFGGGSLRAVAVEKPRIRLDLSVGGSLNSSADPDGLRQGMPDLDFLFEFGPQLTVRLFEHRLASGAFWQGRFSSELRAVFATDFRGVNSQGFLFESGVGVNLRNLLDSRVDLISSLTLSLADERLQDYFYEVPPAFETPVRPVYDANSGYLESKLSFALAYKFQPRVRLFAGVNRGFFSGASNEGSPLFETTEQTSYALGFVWTVKTSDRMISVIDMGTSQ